MAGTTATYIDHMGTDLSVVNAARVSFGKTSSELSGADKGLIRFLARGCTSSDWDSIQMEATLCTKDEIEEVLNYVRKMPDHWTPFGHTAITLHIKAPIFVARQLGKHQVGFVWNEVSRRYVADAPEFYVPDEWREAASSVKQGSSDLVAPLNEDIIKDYIERCRELALDYRILTEDYNICPEQARMVLPQSMMTEWYWTGNLYGFANVFTQRTDSHAQREVQDVAHQIGGIIEPLFPESWKALTEQ